MSVFIGLTGNAGAGKDTIADYLAHDYAFEPYSFADTLKKTVSTCFALVHDQVYGSDKDVIDPAWGITPREILQKTGQAIKVQCARDWGIGNIWIENLTRRIGNGKRIVITDVRFEDEAEYIHRQKGIIVKVIRPDYTNITDPRLRSHVSEQGISHPDYIIYNTSSVENLYSKVDILMSNILN